jgi:protein-tyrosine kinase
MSRVSRALERANEERVQQKTGTALAPNSKNGSDGENGLSKAADLVGPKIMGQGASAAAIEEKGLQGSLAIGNSPKGNRNGRAPIEIIPDFRLNGKPVSWLDRIQNLVLGRAPSDSDAYPLFALAQNSPAAEQYKILREQIKKICGDERVCCLAVTSPIKGDGKTTVAANLAATMALDYEQQVLLIDADIRSPSIHRFFGINGSPGLADYLSSNSATDLESYVQNTTLAGLRILPAGKSSRFSSELLATDRMRSLVSEIPVRFPGHQVIIDTSPILSTPDPLVVGRLVDGVIMVVRARKTPRGCLAEAMTSLGANKIVGVVLNGAELGMDSRYYYYSSAS